MIAERFDAADSGALGAAAGALSNGREAVLQFSAPPYSSAHLDRINGLCQEHGDRLEVRFYAHYGGEFDFDVLDAVPSVTNLSTDCLQKATNFEALGRLQKLRRLSFGIFECSAKNVLDLLDPDSIRELSLGENRGRNFDLGRLREFRELRSLFIAGHTKSIESLADIPSLESLRLSMIPKKQGLDFVSAIPRLRHQQLILGGREDISEIQGETIEELEIRRVRGLSQFPSLSSLPALRSLQIDDQLRLTEVEIQSQDSRLAKLVINNCKKLCRIEGLASLQGLEHLRLCVRDCLACVWISAHGSGRPAPPLLDLGHGPPPRGERVNAPLSPLLPP